MFCGNCGKEIKNGEKFCTSCGTPVPGSGEANVQNPENQVFEAYSSAAASVQPSFGPAPAAINRVNVRGFSKKSGIIIAAVLAVVVIAGIVIFNIAGGSKPEAVVEKFINAINEKDIKGAIKCMDPKYDKAFNAASNLASNFLGGVQMTDIADLLPGAMDLMHASGDQTDLKLKVVKVVSQDIKGDTAVIKVQLQGTSTDSKGKKNSDVGTATFQLQKFSEGWRIINMK